MELSPLCRSALYRLCMTAPAQTFVFLRHVQSLDSFSDLIHFGVSADRHMRVFEANSRAGKACFIATPLFLTTDASLLGKWAQLQASCETAA